MRVQTTKYLEVQKESIRLVVLLLSNQIMTEKPTKPTVFYKFCNQVLTLGGNERVVVVDAPYVCIKCWPLVVADAPDDQECEGYATMDVSSWQMKDTLGG